MYFEREDRCGDGPREHAVGPLYCSKRKNHTGRHVAHINHDTENDVLLTWANDPAPHYTTPVVSPLGDDHRHHEIGAELGSLVDEKNRKYGQSFAKSGDFLRMLWPDGIKPDQYQDMLTIIRIFDKMNRIATDKDAFGEDPFSDITGYALLAVGMRRAEAGK